MFCIMSLPKECATRCWTQQIALSTMESSSARSAMLASLDQRDTALEVVPDSMDTGAQFQNPEGDR